MSTKLGSAPSCSVSAAVLLRADVTLPIAGTLLDYALAFMMQCWYRPGHSRLTTVGYSADKIVKPCGFKKYDLVSHGTVT